MELTYILLSEKKWHQDLFVALQQQIPGNWIWIRNRNNFTIEQLKALKPEYIFIPHWSYIIPEEIFNTFECIVFHMTDLPYGRGGSPLQNLILRGHKQTKITALKVDSGIDTGAVYLKKDLALVGTAKEIFERATPIILEMIKEIIDNKLLPKSQHGNPIHFKRRKAEDSSIEKLEDLDLVYDYIRMVDCEGYPNAFIETEFLKIQFTDAKLLNNEITANVRITKK